ncbi:hypothetical protein TNCV_2304991 [Trichonephila clavipes]|nr:hypothetical protein TNCV_2304991 [Trichonephila clavipes]
MNHKSVVVAQVTYLTKSDRSPRNSSWQWARCTPVVCLSLEHHAGSSPGATYRPTVRREMKQLKSTEAQSLLVGLVGMLCRVGCLFRCCTRHLQWFKSMKPVANSSRIVPYNATSKNNLHNGASFYK